MSSEEAAKSATPSVAPRTSVLAPSTGREKQRQHGEDGLGADVSEKAHHAQDDHLARNSRNSLEVPGALVAVEGRANVLLWIIPAVGRENGQ